jgi:hypothetical protein
MAAAPRFRVLRTFRRSNRAAQSRREVYFSQVDRAIWRDCRRLVMRPDVIQLRPERRPESLAGKTRLRPHTISVSSVSLGVNGGGHCTLSAVGNCTLRHEGASLRPGVGLLAGRGMGSYSCASGEPGLPAKRTTLSHAFNSRVESRERPRIVGSSGKLEVPNSSHKALFKSRGERRRSSKPGTTNEALPICCVLSDRLHLPIESPHRVSLSEKMERLQVGFRPVVVVGIESGTTRNDNLAIDLPHVLVCVVQPRSQHIVVLKHLAVQMMAHLTLLAPLRDDVAQPSDRTPTEDLEYVGHPTQLNHSVVVASVPTSSEASAHGEGQRECRERTRKVSVPGSFPGWRVRRAAGPAIVS